MSVDEQAREYSAHLAGLLEREREALKGGSMHSLGVSIATLKIQGDTWRLCWGRHLFRMCRKTVAIALERGQLWSGSIHHHLPFHRILG